MYQLPVNNLTRIRRARKQVKKTLGDIGLEFCKEAAEEFKEFCPTDQYVKSTLCLDICAWDPSYSKTQEYRSKPFCCTECSFSSKYYSGYKNHFRNVHRKIFDGKILLNCPYCGFIANKRTLETHVKIFHMPSSARQSYGSSLGAAPGSKDKMYMEKSRREGVEKAMYFCKKCTFRDTLYNVVRRHIYREHFQHIVSPYLGVVSESSIKNGANSVNGNNILCKRCQFSTRSYEALVQHVIEYHERIGAQVTTMIGHANIVVSRPQSSPGMSQKASVVMSRGHALRSELMAQPVIGYLKPVASAVKNHSSISTSQARVSVPGNSAAAENSAAGVNTAQTQKWKICTVCNELFPENLYSAHFESAHKAKKVWALAKYIMKIHNFTSKCLLCNRYLPSDTLLNHMLIHGLTCPQCHSAFHNVEKMMEHVAQAHPDEFVGPPGASPLTFDLTIKQDKSSNVQLAVLTFNMKEPINGQDQSAPTQNSAPPRVKLTAPRMIEKSSESLASFSSRLQKSEVGKTVCPLCFTILKGPIADALAMHLRERHQVLQTMHPVEKKMTYKCIHCLGVYTSNMVASTITLHLVQCRAVGRNQASQGFKSALTLNSSGVGFLKRQPPMQAFSNPKRMKLGKDSKISATTFGNQVESVSLALDPRSFEHKTYEARKNFLTAYFNRRPYLTTQEEEKLSASLWLWKSDIACHFATKRRMCERRCENQRLSVLLGFDMQALKKVKHNLIFEESTGVPVGRSVGLKSGTPCTDQNKQGETLNCTLKLSTFTETISLDSDDEPEIEDRPAENGNTDTNRQEYVKPMEQVDLTEESQPAGTDDPSAENGNVDTNQHEYGQPVEPVDLTEESQPAHMDDSCAENEKVETNQNQYVQPLGSRDLMEERQPVGMDELYAENENVETNQHQYVPPMEPLDLMEEPQLADTDDASTGNGNVDTHQHGYVQRIEPLNLMEDPEPGDTDDPNTGNRNVDTNQHEYVHRMEPLNLMDDPQPGDTDDASSGNGNVNTNQHMYVHRMEPLNLMDGPQPGDTDDPNAWMTFC